MTAGVRTIQNILQNPGTGQPIVNKTVTIRLNTVGFINSGSVEKLQQRYATTDSTGMWSAVLEVNSDINPAGSYYTVREANGVVWTFVVPAGDPAVPLNLNACLSVAPQAGPVVVSGLGGVTITNVPTAVGQVLAITSLSPLTAAWSSDTDLTLVLIDNHDGTYTVEGTGVVDNGNGTFTITDPGVTDLGGGLMSIAA